MPRLTNTDYLQHRNLLLEVWQHHRNAFIALEPNEQWSLHQFFQLAAERPAEQLLRYRGVLTGLYPSLPQRAGRAFQRLKRWHDTATKFAGDDPAAYREAIVELAGIPANTPSHGDRLTYVQGEVHPELNKRKLAQALLAAVQEREAGYVRPTNGKPVVRRPKRRT